MALFEFMGLLSPGETLTRTVKRVSGKDWYGLNVISLEQRKFKVTIQCASNGECFESLYESPKATNICNETVFIGPTYLYIQIKVTNEDENNPNTIKLFATPFERQV